jgi:hypothetical protein
MPLGLLVLALSALPLALCAQSATRPDQTPESTIQEWPRIARAAALIMISEYGEPEQFGPDALVWNNNGPWQETAVYREPKMHRAVMRDKDYLKQTVSCVVPSGKTSRLKSFDRRIDVDTNKNELSAQTESESTNRLALNLAMEIITGKRSAAGARAFYIKTEELAQSGKGSPYLERLLFQAPSSDDDY